MRLRKFGALADADLGVATQQIDALSTRRLDLQRALIEAQRGGVVVSAGLSASIMGLDAEWDALDQSIMSISHAELPHWLAQAQALANEIASLETQLAQASGADQTRTLVVLVVGGVVSLAVAGGLAYYVKKHTKNKGRSRRAPGLFGTPAQHKAAGHRLLNTARSHLKTGRDDAARDEILRARQEAEWTAVVDRTQINSEADALRTHILVDRMRQAWR